jgi:hypothetical protein
MQLEHLSKVTTFSCFGKYFYLDFWLKFLLQSEAFLVRGCTVATTKSQFFALDYFSVASFVDLAAAMSTNFKAWLQCHAYQFGEAFEQLLRECFTFSCKFKYLLFLCAHWL